MNMAPRLSECLQVKISMEIHFPKCEDLKKLWENAVGRENWKSTRWQTLCSVHFEPSCFDRTGQTTRLREGSIPTIFSDFRKYHQKFQKPSVRKKLKVRVESRSVPKSSDSSDSIESPSTNTAEVPKKIQLETKLEGCHKLLIKNTVMRTIHQKDRCLTEEVHFDEKQCEKVRVDGKRKLKYGAVPTVFVHTTRQCSKKPQKQPPSQNTDGRVEDEQVMLTENKSQELSSSKTLDKRLEEEQVMPSENSACPTTVSIQKTATSACPSVSTEIESHGFSTVVSLEELTNTACAIPPVIYMVKSVCSTCSSITEDGHCKSCNQVEDNSSSNTEMPDHVVTTKKYILELEQKVQEFQTAAENALEENDSLRYRLKLSDKKLYHERMKNIYLSRNMQKLFRQDQLKYLEQNSSRGVKWSQDTLQDARQLKFALGKNLYLSLIERNWPLPSLRMLRRKQEKPEFQNTGFQANKKDNENDCNFNKKAPTPSSDLPTETVLVMEVIQTVY